MMPYNHPLTSRRFDRRKPLTARLAGSRLVRLVVAYSFLLGQVVFAAPQGEQVVAGQADFQRSGDVTQITTSHQAIINYSSFDIHSHETVRFVQPNEMSRVLNRVNSPNPTEIAGRLQANGQVYIVNPAGIYFANGALVDVGGIYAAAASISNTDFLSNVDHFTDVSGSVVNHGTIQGRFAHLIGKHVANYGTIVADNRGLITMVSGDDVLLGQVRDHWLVRLKGAAADAQNNDADNSDAGSELPGVTNAGKIEAKKGRVRLAAGDLISLALQDTSTVKADTIEAEGGDGSLVEVSGTLDASNTSPGEIGGTVHVLGDKVALYGAQIDVSGDAGGGEVLIGGDYQGNGIVRNAARTLVDADTVIRADALTHGKGGRVIVWANQITGYAGAISARGGTLGGDGGFAEVSGKEGLLFQGTADLTAPQGSLGTLLLDPQDITIRSDAGTPTLPDNLVEFGDTPLNMFILNTSVRDALNTANVELKATQDIFVNAEIAPTSGTNDLTLRARNDIKINAPIKLNGGNLTAIANDNGSGGGNITLGEFVILVNANTVTLNAGSGKILVPDGTSTPFLRSSGTTTITQLNLTASQISDVAGSGAFAFAGAENLTVVDTGGGAILLKEVGIVETSTTTLLSPLTDVVIDVSDPAAAGRVELEMEGTVGPPSATSQRTLFILDNGTDLGTLALGEAGLTLNSDFTFTLNAGTKAIQQAVVTGGVTGPTAFQTERPVTIKAGSITLDGAPNETTGMLAFNNNFGQLTLTARTGDVTVGNTGPLVFGGDLTANVAGALTLTGAGVTIDSPLNVGGGLILDGTTGQVTVNQALASTGTLEIDGEGIVINNNLTAATAIDLDSTSGNLNFLGAPTLDAPTIALRATNGGTINASTPAFVSGTGSPAAFTFEQDGAVNASALPGNNRFTNGGLAGLDYTVKSTTGKVTIGSADSSKFAGMDLILEGASIDLSGGLALGSGSLTANTNNGAGDITFTGPTASVTTEAGQSYTGNLKFNADTTLKDDGDEALVIAGDVSGTGSLTLDIKQGTRFTQAVTLDQTITQAEGAGPLVFQGDVTLNGTDTNTFNGRVRFSNQKASGALALTSAGALVFEDAVELAGGATSISTDNKAIAFESTISGNQALTVNSGTAQTTFANAVGSATSRLESLGLIADETTIDQDIFVSDFVTLAPSTPTREVAIGVEESAGGRLEFTNAELGRIDAPGGLVIGSTDTGNIAIEGAVSLAKTNAMVLRSGGNFTGSLDRLDVTALGLDINGPIDNLTTQVENLAARSRTGGITIKNNEGSLTITRVGDLAGLKANDDSGGSGDIVVTASGGITVEADGPVTSKGGGIWLDARGGDLALGGPVDAGGGSVVLQAQGGITGNGAVSGDALAIDTGNAVELTTTIQDVAARSRNGGIRITKNGGNLNITTVSVGGGAGSIAGLRANDDSGSGSIQVVSDGGITVGAAVDSNSGGIDLMANGGAVTVNRPVRSDGGNISVTASEGVNVDQSIASSGGDIDLIANGADRDMVLGANVNAGGGGVSLIARSSAITGSGRVTGGALTAIARDNIGTAGQALMTQVGTLAAKHEGTTGGINILNAGSLTIGDPPAGGGFSEDVTGVTTAASTGGVVVKAQGQLNVDHEVRSLGDITLEADSQIAFGANGDVLGSVPGTTGSDTLNTADKLVRIDAGLNASGTGRITMADGAQIDAGNARIVLTSPEGITLGGLKTNRNDAGGVAVTLTTDGAVVDGGAAHLDVDAPAGTLLVNNASSIGDSDALEAAVAKVDFNNIGGGAALTNTAGLMVKASNIGGGLTLTAEAGNITDDGALGVNGLATFITQDTAAGSGRVTLDGLSGGAVALDTTGDATLTSSGALAIQGSSVGGQLEAQTTTGALTVSDATTVGGMAKLTAAGAGGGIRLNGALASAGGEFDAGTSSFTTNAAVDVKGGGATITAERVALGGDFQGSSGILVLEPEAADTGINIGFEESGGYNLTSETIENITGFDRLQIGRIGGRHTVRINNDPAGKVTFNVPVVIHRNTDPSQSMTNLTGKLLSGGHDIAINSPLEVSGGAVEIDTGNGGIQIAGAVDGPAELTLRSGGTVNLGGDVGGAQPLTSITANAGTLDLHSVTTTGAQTYTAGTITSRSSRGVTKNVYESTGSGDITFDGAVKLNLETQVLAHSGSITFNDTVAGEGKKFILEAAGGGIVLGGAVEVGSVSATTTSPTQVGDITVHDITARTGDIKLQVNPEITGSNLSDLQLALVRVNGTLKTNGGNISLNEAGRSLTPSVATIAGEGDTQVITDGGEFKMGLNEKFTALGDLSIDVGNSGTATVGDLSAKGDITVKAQTVDFNLRPEGKVLPIDGGSPEDDQGLDIVAQGKLDFSGVTTLQHKAGTESGLNPDALQVVLSSGGSPLSQTELDNLAGKVSGNILKLGIPKEAISDVMLSIEADGIITAFLDGTVGRVDTSTGIANIFSFFFEADLPDVGDDASLEQSEKDLLRLMGIPAEDMTLEQLLELFAQDQVKLINDIAHPDSQLGEHRVTTDRMWTPIVHAALGLYLSLYRQTEIDEQGQTVIRSRSAHIKDVLTEAWIDYKTTGREFGPMDFEQYLRMSYDHEEALDCVVKLRGLFKQLRMMGLTSRELAYTKTVLLEKEGIIPDGMSQEEFEEVVLQPPAQAAAVPIEDDMLEQEFEFDLEPGQEQIEDEVRRQDAPAQEEAGVGDRLNRFGLAR